MAAEPVFIDDEEEEELPESVIWQPEPEIVEDPFVLEQARARIAKLPSVRPSQFTETTFMMPTAVGTDESQTVELQNFSFNERPHLRRIYDTPSKRVLLMCARQVEKCQPSCNTQTILLSCGMPIPAFEVEVGQSLISWDERRQKTVSKKVVAKQQVGKKPCLLLTTRQGHELRVATTHPILTPEGWVEAQYLQEKTRVGAVRRGGNFGQAGGSGDWGALLAYLIADGSIGTASGLRFSKKHGPVLDDFKGVLQRLYSVQPKSYQQKRGVDHSLNHVRPLIADLRVIGLWGCYSKDKFIPEEVFYYNRKNTALFLNRLWACDGSVGQATNTKYDIEYASISLRLVRQVQALLWKFGVPTSFRKYQPTAYQGTDKWSYILRVETRAGIRRFLEEIGALGKSEGVPLPDESVPERGNRDTIPASLVRRLIEEVLPAGTSLRSIGLTRFPAASVTQDRLRTIIQAVEDAGATVKAMAPLWRLQDSDLYWDEIESIEEMGEEPCFDIEVEDTHNFALNGVFTHNSTLLGNISICYSCIVPGFRTLYVSPSNRQTVTFSADRIKEPLETSKVLKQFTTKMLSQNILEKQFVNRSKITLRYAFLNADRCRGIPAWSLLIDEIQDVLSDNVPVIEQCLAHAPEHWRRFIYSGTPKSLDNSIETYWSSRSTMNEWVVPCDACNFWNILGEKNIGKKGLICEKCGTLIYAMNPRSQWAAHRKQDDIKVPFEGYRINQLMVPWVQWSEILLNYEDYPRDRFYNEVLGISYDSGLRPLTRAQVQACCNPDVSMQNLDEYKSLSAGQPIFAGIDWGCHDADTRILTRDGLKYFKDLLDSDEVAQWDPDTREMSYARPAVVTIRDWDQPLLHFKTKGGVDMALTHTHRMRVGVQQGERWLTEAAGEFAQRGGNAKFVGHVTWRGDEESSFTLPGLPVSAGYQGSELATFPMDDWLEFLGYYLSEGGLCLNKNKAGEGRPYCIEMSQRETVSPTQYEKIKSCMQRLGIKFQEYPNPKTGDVNWTICGKQWWSWFEENVGLTGDTKRVPTAFKSLSQRQLRILFDAMMLGDGSIDPRDGCTGGAYYSTSRRLCEDFQELCVKLGLRCLVRLHKPAAGNRRARYRALWSAGRDYTFNTPSTKVERVPYKGKVYCCSVPTGYIVTERNGCISYQGNTGEHSYTVLTLATYIGGKFRAFYVHRFTGEDVEPDRQMDLIIGMLRYFNVRLIGTDYGGGFYPNDKLIRVFGRNRVWKYQYTSNPKNKVRWNPELGRFLLHRTDVMSDIFNAIKRKRDCEFPKWEEFETPYAQDMLNIFSESNNMLRMIQYKHAQDKPDDTFHSFLYCWMVSMLMIRRPDIVKPGKEDAQGFQEVINMGNTYQG